MIDYLEIASRALEQFQTRPELDRAPAALMDSEHVAASPDPSPDPESGKVWISWFEWKARELNRLFRMSCRSGNITAETVRDGIEREGQGKRKS